MPNYCGAFARINLSRDLADAVLEQFAVSGDVLLGAGWLAFEIKREMYCGM